MLSAAGPAGPPQPYRFEDAREYWANVPRAQGSDPFNNRLLGDVSDAALVEEFLREVEIGRKKEERRVGYKRAAESLANVERPRVMDYGSGIGFYGYEILCRFPDVRVTFVDINPAKQGTFLAGTGHEIRSPDALRRAAADAVVVLNPIYLSEIRAHLGELGLEPEVLTA